MNELTLSLIQTPLHWQDRETNFKHFERLLELVGESDLVLLPEMFTTGFSMKPQELWDSPEGETSDWLRKMAQQHNTAISGSAIIKDGDDYYNRLYFVFPDGSAKYYDKKHLFTLAGEHKVYSAGQEHLIVDYKGWRIMPLVCYDLRFPVWCRNTADVDLQYFVANWPEKRSYAWKSLLCARAIENMCYVAGLNRVGDDGKGVSHSGDSAVYDELGKPLLKLTPFEEQVSSITLQKDKMLESRERFQFLTDRDEFTLSGGRSAS